MKHFKTLVKFTAFALLAVCCCLNTGCAGKRINKSTVEKAGKEFKQAWKDSESARNARSNYNRKKKLEELLDEYKNSNSQQDQQILSPEYCLNQGTNCWRSGNRSEAMSWWLIAAEKGNAEAQFLIGLRYHEGDAVGQNYYEAAKWFNSAAAQGYVRAYTYLGDCYRYGRGVSQNINAASQYYQVAAQYGDSLAIYRLQTFTPWEMQQIYGYNTQTYYGY